MSYKEGIERLVDDMLVYRYGEDVEFSSLPSDERLQIYQEASETYWSRKIDSVVEELR